MRLPGHTAGNRLDIMALRPAPVQVTYLGYPNTTGKCIYHHFTNLFVNMTQLWHLIHNLHLPFVSSMIFILATYRQSGLLFTTRFCF